ncbi:MAG: PEP-CTERM sorting domain-containing protein [Candidatus Marinimicrobia bacterium]|nr:PEP-CTERM sorting domain-containing protein [Candidatus Neomarinimicrobiota bacterium]
MRTKRKLIGGVAGLMILVAATANASLINVALDVSKSSDGEASLDGWAMAYATGPGLWRTSSTRSVSATSNGHTVTFTGYNGSTGVDYTRDYIANDYGSQGAVTETRKFVEDGFFNDIDALYTTISGLQPGKPVEMWFYAWGGGNLSGTTRYYFDLNNDGNWDTDLLGSGADYVDVSTLRTAVPNVIAPELLVGEGFAVGSSQSGAINYGILQINFTPTGDTIRFLHDKVAGNGWLNGVLISQIPEPSALMLLALGIGLVVVRRRRR